MDFNMALIREMNEQDEVVGRGFKHSVTVREGYENVSTSRRTDHCQCEVS